MSLASAGWLRRFLIEMKIKVLDWGKGQKVDYLDAPKKPGVYALYWGRKLQYIGKSEKSLRKRISDWHGEDYYGTNERIPFSSFAWFVLRKNQVNIAETFLVAFYNPPYNLTFPLNW